MMMPSVPPLMPLEAAGSGWFCPARRRCSLMRLTISGALIGLSAKSLAPAARKVSATVWLSSMVKTMIGTLADCLRSSFTPSMPLTPGIW